MEQNVQAAEEIVEADRIETVEVEKDPYAQDDVYRSHTVPCSDEEVENVGSDK